MKKHFNKIIIASFGVVCFFAACSKGGSSPTNTNTTPTPTDPYTVSTLAGGNRAGFADGTGTAAGFAYPCGIVLDASGTLFVADPNTNRIRKVTADGVVTTLAQSGFFAGTPKNIALDSKGNSYIIGQSVVYKVSPTGTISVFATADLYDNPNAIGLPFGNPVGLVADASDNIYLTSYDTPVVLKITPTGTITQFGNGGMGSVDGTGAAVSFNYPQGLVADASGNVYVADESNPNLANAVMTIRKISATGTVTTITPIPSIAGSGNANGLEQTTLALDAAGNFYAANNPTGKIYKITASGTSTLIAGAVGVIGAFTINGPALSATFNLPHGIAVNSTGTIIYVADSGSNLIRKIVKQ